MLSSLIYILLMILGFGALIFFHELGHFMAAKWAGIRTEGFAVGMGPVLLSYRKGTGLTFGSTTNKVKAMTGRDPSELSDDALAANGLGETEYSLRALPLGGFVKMLGQDDVNPNAISDAPRSYTRCSIGKRMIVVSAGVIMNLILAAILFVVAFMYGVQFPAPIVGETLPGSPAATTMASNAAELGVTVPGLFPGDTILSIDDVVSETFSDITLGAAMAKPDQIINVVVQRAGVDGDLNFAMKPVKGSQGLLSIGINPAASTTLIDKAFSPDIDFMMDSTGLREQGVEFGMRLMESGGESIATFEQFGATVANSNGAPVETLWSKLDDGEPVGELIRATIDPEPMLQTYTWLDRAPEPGLLGLTPLIRVESVMDDTNRGKLEVGDVLIQVGDVAYPRLSSLLEFLDGHDERTVPATVLRNGERLELECAVNRDQKLGITISRAIDMMVLGDPIVNYSRYDADGQIVEAKTAIADEPPLPGSTLTEIDGTAVSSWVEMRAALQAAVSARHTPGNGLSVDLTMLSPTAQQEEQTFTVQLDDVHAKQIAALRWSTDVSGVLFESMEFNRSADGSPIEAIRMGMAETKKTIILTYLTIDRLFRGSVGVDQLRGPVGIVDIGRKVLPRGWMYFFFFLGVISVNLAVLNFLPLPIVDGGLFLFLLYEKIKGRPPSIAFQNGAFLFGLVIIGSLFLFITFNDVMRLF